MSALKIWNRTRNEFIREEVYGQGFLKFAYGTRAGRWLADRLFSCRFVSVLYGFLQSSSLSRLKVTPFIRRYSIEMEEYDKKDYLSFNDFFIRRFRPGRRMFDPDPNHFPSPAEGRVIAFQNIEESLKFPLKGVALTVGEAIGEEEAARFQGGALIVVRLCPLDYHRFHFPDHGKVLKSYRIPGKFHSVNPGALKTVPGVFRINEREVTLLETRNFGALAYVEVGAMMVGKIIQTHSSLISDQATFSRGDEKGYFLFGASTVFLLFEKDTIQFDQDLLAKTKEGIETFVKLGEKIGVSKPR